MNLRSVVKRQAAVGELHPRYVGRAEAQQMRDTLARAIVRQIEGAGITQDEIARPIGTSQARVSNLKCGRTHAFTLDFLIMVAVRLGLSPTLRL